MAKDYLIVKIDTDRMINGKDVAKKLRKEARGGIPWMVILDAQGKTLITSDGPKGNIGCPIRPEERAFFLTMLEKTSQRMTSDDRALIGKALATYAKKFGG